MFVKNLKKAYTLAEIIIVMLIIAVIASVCIKITKNKLDKIVTYTYYTAYSTINSVVKEMYRDFDSSINGDYISFLFPPASAANNCYRKKAVGNKMYCVTYEFDSACNRSDILNKFNNKISALTDIYGAGIFSDLIADGIISNDDYVIYAEGTKDDCMGITKPIDSAPSSIITLNCEVSPEYLCTQTFVGKILNFKIEELPDEPVETKCNLTPPSPIPCGKKWDNSAEVCGLTDITPWPPICPVGQEFNPKKEVCNCVPITPAIPRKGENFCKLFVSYSNTSPSLINGGEECKGDNINEDNIEFINKKPDIVLRNGMRLYNLTKDPDKIEALTGNSRGKTYPKADETEIDIDEAGYIIYVDIDGRNGNSILWEDVFPFYITLSGTVIPAYDNDDNSYLQTSVYDEYIDENGRHVEWITKSTSFKESACSMGYVKEETPYCASVKQNDNCKLQEHDCAMKTIVPIKFL